MNKHRGEVEIALTIEGEERKLAMRPTMEFIAEVEARYGGIVQLARRFNNHEWTVGEMVGIVQAAVAHDRTVKATTVKEAVVSGGPFNFVAPVSVLLLNVLTGGREVQEGNAEAAS